MKKYAQVIVDVASSQVDKIFDYVFFEDEYKIGQRVIVPFGNRKIEGYIIGIKDSSDLADEKLKQIVGKVDNFQIFDQEQIDLMYFMQKKYNLKMIDIIRLFLPSEMRTGKIKPLVKVFLQIDKQNIAKLATLKPNSKVYNFAQTLECDVQYEQADLNKISTYATNKLKEIGFLKEISKNVFRTPQVFDIEQKKVKLNQSQQNAVEKICLDQSKSYVLFGVTGSGKTEVYFSVIDKTLENGRNAILLVPEIALTPQMLSQMKGRFGDKVAILHSGLSSGERFDEWTRIRMGQARVVIGARSAIFAPLTNIGLIVIDEEHDASYISENNPRYNTLEIAKKRADFYNCPLVLGSATPSIEDFYKTQIGEFELINMPERINHNLPDMFVIDMLAELREGNSSMFSRKLLSELISAMQKGQQAMIFINRRGYSSFQMCRECGYVAKCDDCDVSLVYHKEEERLKCHYCGKTYKALTRCPNCGSNAIKLGAIGTQKVVLELQKIFDNIKIFRMDNDTTGTKGAHQKILQQFSNTKPAILVGTQMIAKGHDFGDVTIVGILDADQSLFCSDYKSNERTFQLITQVSGRAGRSNQNGVSVIQTFCPKHYVFRYACCNDYKGFYDKEINLRKTTKFPPWTQIVRLLFSSENDTIVLECLQNCYQQIKNLAKLYQSDFVYLNAMKAPHKRIMRKFRYQILLRITPERQDEIMQKIYEIVNSVKDKNVSVFAEINPNNLS